MVRPQSLPVNSSPSLLIPFPRLRSLPLLLSLFFYSSLSFVVSLRLVCCPALRADPFCLSTCPLQLEEAKTSIMILDWWLSPELYLRRPPAKYPEYRLDRLLKRRAEAGVKIMVICYKASFSTSARYQGPVRARSTSRTSSRSKSS